jgi:aspartate beta-hydroxylase
MNTPAQAQRLLRAGRIAEAEAAYEAVLAQFPDDAEALNVVALAAIRRRDLARARALLEHAVAAHPTDAQSRYHLGRALDESGELDAAKAAYAAALQAQPGLYLARLHLANVHDRSGAAGPALQEYVAALHDAQRQGRWLDPATTPQNLQPLVERAVQTIMGAKRGIAERTLEELTQQYGRSELRRVERALRIHLREELPSGPDPRQQPTFFYFPELPPSPYLCHGDDGNRVQFPWIEALEALEAQTPLIRQELRRVLTSSAGHERVFLDAEVEQLNLRGTDAAPGWTGYYFYRHGQQRADAIAACPATAAALAALPLAHVPGHGPEVLYSVFMPGTHLLPHRGVTNTRVVGHLPLIVPQGCALRVAGEEHAWTEGRVVIFDDTYEHEAWNRSAEIRVVLIFDLWNPGLSAVERVAVARILARLGVLSAPGS